MRLKQGTIKSIILFSIILTGWSCTDEPDLLNYTTTIRNSSGENFTVRGFNVPNELIVNANIDDGQSLEACTASSEVFLGLGCGIDSLIIEFENGKGYICANRPNANAFCFGKSPLIGIESNFNQIDDNSFEFMITQQDFENAFELPDQ